MHGHMNVKKFYLLICLIKTFVLGTKAPSRQVHLTVES